MWRFLTNYTCAFSWRIGFWTGSALLAAPPPLVPVWERLIWKFVITLLIVLFSSLNSFGLRQTTSIIFMMRLLTTPIYLKRTWTRRNRYGPQNRSCTFHIIKWTCSTFGLIRVECSTLSPMSHWKSYDLPPETSTKDKLIKTFCIIRLRRKCHASIQRSNNNKNHQFM